MAQREVPPDNDAAERNLRPVATHRKVSDGTRSNQGAETEMTLVSISGAWW